MRVDTAKRSSGRRQYRKNNLPNGTGVRRLARWRMQAIRSAARMTHHACRLAETSTLFATGLVRWRTRPITQFFLQRNGPTGSVPCRSLSGPGAEPCSTYYCIPASHARRTAFDPQGALVRQPYAVGRRAVAEQEMTARASRRFGAKRYAKRGLCQERPRVMRSSGSAPGTDRIDGRLATRPAPA